MGRIKIDYGIDLGTTNSALAVINNGEIEVKEYDRSKIIPSCVAYNRKGTVRAGIDATNMDPNFIEFKRKMGSDWKDRKHSELNEYVGAEDLSSEILKKIKSEITHEYFKSVVITVPAMFDMNQVAATKRAGELAGFEQIEILMEPVAAAFNYGFKNKIGDAQYVVFDFGGGTFDAALVKSEGGIMSVVSSEGDNYLGGKDLDNAVLENVLLPIIQQNFEIDSLSESALELLKRRLKRIADTLKIDLGKTESVDILTNLGDLGDDSKGNEIEIDKTFTRSEVHGAMTPYFMRAIGHAKKLLEVNNLTASDLKAFVLVGGPTQIPLFRQLIEQEIMKPDTSTNPMTAIAEGAALYAATFNSTCESHGDPIGVTGAETSNEIEAVKLEIQYAATTTQTREAIGIKRKNTTDSYSVIVSREDGQWTSSRHDLDDVIMADIASGKPNSFKIQLFDSSSNPAPCSPNQFTIIPGTSVDGGAPLPYHIGMAVNDARKGNIFTPFRGLEKDKKLPLVGRIDRELYNVNELRPGIEEDKMTIAIYCAERDARDSRSIINLFMDNIEVNGMDVQRRVPENSLIEFTLKIDISQNLTLEIEFPHLDMDVITKTMKFPAKSAVKKEQIDVLVKEIENGILKLEKSVEKVLRLEDLKSMRNLYIQNLSTITDNDFDGVFGNLRSLLLEIDIAVEGTKWPTFKKQLIDSLFDFEELVKDCVKNRLDGWEKDQSDLEHFTKQKEQLFDMPKPDLSNTEELIDSIKSASLRIVARHQGKELFTDFIEHYDRDFNKIDWKNQSQARQEIDHGLSLIRSGADKDSLQRAVRAILSQMKNPDIDGPTTGGIKT
jgi:molecular chaperone DnaK